MNENSARVASVVVAVAGAAVSGYLLYARYAEASLVCSTGGCETVQGSRYSSVFGMPVAAFGLGAFVALAAAATAPGELARSVQAVVALAAAVFSGYLLVVQLAVIGAICDWCVATDALLGASAALALLRVRAAARPTRSSPPAGAGKAPMPPRRPRAKLAATRRLP